MNPKIDEIPICIAPSPENEKIISTFEGSPTLDRPELSEWECYLFGTKGDGIIWRPNKNEVPNSFWRWMQFICFGNRWSKRK